MLYLTGIIIAFFLFLLLFGKKGKSEADNILALWLLGTGFHLLLYYFNFTGDRKELPLFLGIEIPLPLLQGPFLYLYTSTLTNQKDKRALWNFAPVAIVYLLLIPFYNLTSAQKISVYNNDGLGYEKLMGMVYILIIVSGIIYPILSYLKILRHKKNIRNRFTYTETINLAWLRYLIAGTGIIWLVVIIGTDKHVFSAAVAYILFIGYFGIKQVGIFTNSQPFYEASTEIQTENVDVIPPAIETTEEPQAARIKYEKSRLSDEDSQAIHKRLTQLMAQEKLFKNPELTLAELSERLDVHPNVLSQVINSIEQKNLYDYVNEQRVEEFKYLVTLPENQKFTLLSLAYECGYNSKTAFNRNFKKVTGVSPTAYIKEVDIKLS